VILCFNVNNLTFKGRISPLSGSSENLTVSQATSMLNVFVGDTGSGSLRSSTSNYFRWWCEIS
jgi:hypothetical protein